MGRYWWGKILVNDAQFAKISLPILINVVETTEDLPSDLPSDSLNISCHLHRQ